MAEGEPIGLEKLPHCMNPSLTIVQQDKPCWFALHQKGAGVASKALEFLDPANYLQSGSKVEDRRRNRWLRRWLICQAFYACLKAESDPNLKRTAVQVHRPSLQALEVNDDENEHQRKPLHQSNP